LAMFWSILSVPPMKRLYTVRSYSTLGFEYASCQIQTSAWPVLLVQHQSSLIALSRHYCCSSVLCSVTSNMLKQQIQGRGFYWNQKHPCRLQVTFNLYSQTPTQLYKKQYNTRVVPKVSGLT